MRKIALGVIVGLLAVLSLPGAADAQYRRFGRRYGMPGYYPYPYYGPQVIVPFNVFGDGGPASQGAHLVGGSALNLPGGAVDTLPPPPQSPTFLPALNDRAQVTILLPSTANDIWVDGEKMPTRLTANRVFTSTPLEPGHRYTYTIKASWAARDGLVTRELPAVVAANQGTTVDFTK